jgi:hypothetical protein
MGRITSVPVRRSRLPGVGGPERAGPRHVHSPARDFAAARRRAAVRDLIDIGVLLAVDVLFLWWDSARMPFMTRDTSLWVLLFLHVLVIAGWLRTRFYTPWRARRIARTWSDSERERFTR